MKPQLTIYTGPMFAGKTTALITSWNTVTGPKLAFKYAKDTRYERDQTAIISHEQCNVPAIGISKCEEITAYLNAEIAKQESPSKIAVFIDEGQFFPDIYDWFNSLNVSCIDSIYVSGLDYDIFGKVFNDQFGKLMEAANTVFVYNAKCYICNQPAYNTQFLNSENLNNLTNGNVLIGGEMLFQPACATHFQPVSK